MKDHTTPSAIMANWKRDTNYKSKMKFTYKWPELVRFVEGDQWPKISTGKWKNFTFITVNQCDFIKENKKSNILSQSMKMVFTPNEVPEDMDDETEKKIKEQAQDFTDLAANTWAELDQTQLNEDAVDDALVIGTAFYHYYYDPTYKETKYTKNKGKICGETIDPMDVALGNPQLKPHQINLQPYIIIKTFEDTDKLKKHAREHGDKWQMIVPDVDNDEEYDNGKIDLDSANKTVAYTMYYKEEGEVYWTKVTGTSTVQKPKRLSASERKFTKYPVEMLVFKSRKKSAFGRSILEDVLPVQKAINFLYSMIAYGVQQNAWPKILIKAGALMQSITNEPGEIITDHDKGSQGDSVKFMQPPNFSNMPPVLIDKLTDSMRQTTGATEVSSGEVIGANMAAAAIIALQNQAKKPNESYMKQLYAVNKRIGKILEEFYKCYYILPRTIMTENAKGTLESKTFTPSEYNMEFDMTIDVGAGGEFSEMGQMSFVQGLYDRQDITKYQYVKYAPQALVPQSMRTDFEEEQEKIEEQQRIAEEQAQEQQKLVQEQPPQRDPVDAIMNQLTEEELAAVQADPSLLDGLGGV